MGSFADRTRIRRVTAGEQLAATNDCVIIAHSSDVNLRAAFPDREVVRCLDRFDLLLPSADHRRDAILSGFFEYLHLRYESLIDTARNRDNIANLLSVACTSNPNSSAPLLDFGCGSGLSATLAERFGCTLLGFDLCQGMRELARRRGLVTIDEETLRHRPSGSLRGAFASYVLHLQPRPELLAEMWGSIAQGGVFVANFHKDVGLDQFLAFALELGMACKRLPSNAYDRRHGTYVVCSKR